VNVNAGTIGSRGGPDNEKEERSFAERRKRFVDNGAEDTHVLGKKGEKRGVNDGSRGI